MAGATVGLELEGGGGEVLLMPATDWGSWFGCVMTLERVAEARDSSGGTATRWVAPCMAMMFFESRLLDDLVSPASWEDEDVDASSMEGSGAAGSGAVEEGLFPMLAAARGGELAGRGKYVTGPRGRARRRLVSMYRWGTSPV